MCIWLYMSYVYIVHRTKESTLLNNRNFPNPHPVDGWGTSGRGCLAKMGKRSFIRATILILSRMERPVASKNSSIMVGLLLGFWH